MCPVLTLPSPQVVVEHVRHFVSMSGQPAWQLAALASLSSCLALLAGTHKQVDSRDGQESGGNN